MPSIVRCKSKNIVNASAMRMTGCYEPPMQKLNQSKSETCKKVLYMSNAYYITFTYPSYSYTITVDDYIREMCTVSLQERITEDLTRRHFKLSCIYSNEERELDHYHYTGIVLPCFHNISAKLMFMIFMQRFELCLCCLLFICDGWEKGLTDIMPWFIIMGRALRFEWKIVGLTRSNVLMHLIACKGCMLISSCYASLEKNSNIVIVNSHQCLSSTTRPPKLIWLERPIIIVDAQFFSLGWDLYCTKAELSVLQTWREVRLQFFIWALWIIVS